MYNIDDRDDIAVKKEAQREQNWCRAWCHFTGKGQNKGCRAKPGAEDTEEAVRDCPTFCIADKQ